MAKNPYLFKNLAVYNFTQDINAVLADDLEEKLPRRDKLTGSELECWGFVPPAPGTHPDVLLLNIRNNYIRFRVRKTHREVPGQIWKKALAEKVQQIEQKDQRKVYKKEKDALKDEVLMDLLPRAFVKTTEYEGYFDLKRNFIMLDVTTYKNANTILAMFRGANGTMPVRAVDTQKAPRYVMAEWLKDDRIIPEYFMFAEGAKLAAPDNKHKNSTFNSTSYDEKQMKAALEDGQLVKECLLEYDDSLLIKLCDDLLFKQLKYTEIIQEKLAEEGVEDEFEALEVTQLLMGNLLGSMVNHTIESFGGWYEINANQNSDDS